MPHTPDPMCARVACCHLATYMRCVKLAGSAEVATAGGRYYVACKPARVTPAVLELVPPEIDGVTVKVLV
jgi:hypothetical protein